jgi:hypothetical protein
MPSTRAVQNVLWTSREKVEPHSAILIRGSADWDRQAARDALRAAIRDLWTTSQIGLNWVENHDGDAAYYQLDGLAPLVIAAKGPILLVANSAEVLKLLLARTRFDFAHSSTSPAVPEQRRMDRPELVEGPLGPRENSRATEASQNLIYTAGFRHSAERENIVQMMRLIEMALPRGYAGLAGEEGREPPFFSENLASLSQSLECIESESLVIEDRGPQLLQSVTYRLKK